MPLASGHARGDGTCRLLVLCGPCPSRGKLGPSAPALCFWLCCPSSLCHQNHCFLSTSPFPCSFHPPSLPSSPSPVLLPVSPPPFSPLTLESLFLLLCSSKTISIKVIDDEEYEKNKTFYLEIGEPRLVEMSEKKGGGRAPGLSPACVSLSGSLMSGTCSIPGAYGKGQEQSCSPSPLNTAFPQTTKARPRPGGEGAPALPHTLQGGCAAPFPHPTISVTTAPGRT